MKIILTKENFKKVLGLVGHVVSSSVTLPILSNILIQTEKGRIKVLATNLEIGLSVWLGGKVEEEGSVTLPAKTINEYISTTLGEQVSLETKGNELLVNTDVSEARIKTLPPEEFPLIPKFASAGQFSLEAGLLRSSLTETLFASAPAETQPELAGIYTYIANGRLYFVATDRYRLVERSVEVEQISTEGDFKPMLIPVRAAQEVVRLLSTLEKADSQVAVLQGENQVLFKLPDIELVSRLIDSQFPDYKQIIPDSFTSEAVVPRFELMQAVKSAGLFATTSRSVRVKFSPKEGFVEVSAASGDIGESKVKVTGKVAGVEQENTFNYRYLFDYLNNIADQEIVLKAINDNSPAVLSPSSRTNNLYMVMPIKS